MPQSGHIDITRDGLLATGEGLSRDKLNQLGGVSGRVHPGAIAERELAASVKASLKYAYATVAALQADNSIAAVPTGQTVQLNGYYAAGDFGQALQLVVGAAAAGVLSHTLADGRYANLYAEGSVKVEWFGAKGDGVTDDRAAIQAACDAATASLIGANVFTAPFLNTPGCRIDRVLLNAKRHYAIKSNISIRDPENESATIKVGLWINRITDTNHSSGRARAQRESSLMFGSGIEGTSRNGTREWLGATLVNLNTENIDTVVFAGGSFSMSDKHLCGFSVAMPDEQTGLGFAKYAIRMEGWGDSSDIAATINWLSLQSIQIRNVGRVAGIRIGPSFIMRLSDITMMILPGDGLQVNAATSCYVERFYTSNVARRSIAIVDPAIEWGYAGGYYGPPRYSSFRDLIFEGVCPPTNHLYYPGCGDSPYLHPYFSHITDADYINPEQGYGVGFFIGGTGVDSFITIDNAGGESRGGCWLRIPGKVDPINNPLGYANVGGLVLRSIDCIAAEVPYCKKPGGDYVKVVSATGTAVNDGDSVSFVLDTSMTGVLVPGDRITVGRRSGTGLPAEGEMQGPDDLVNQYGRNTSGTMVDYTTRGLIYARHFVVDTVSGTTVTATVSCDPNSAHTPPSNWPGTAGQFVSGDYVFQRVFKPVRETVFDINLGDRNVLTMEDIHINREKHHYRFESGPTPKIFHDRLMLPQLCLSLRNISIMMQNYEESRQFTLPFTGNPYFRLSHLVAPNMVMRNDGYNAVDPVQWRANLEVPYVVDYNYIAGIVADLKTEQVITDYAARVSGDSGSFTNDGFLQSVVRLLVANAAWEDCVLLAGSCFGRKERVDGSDTYVSKLYDASPLGGDYAQTTTTKQPLLDGDDMDFSAAGDIMLTGDATALNALDGASAFTMIALVYKVGAGGTILSHVRSSGSTHLCRLYTNITGAEEYYWASANPNGTNRQVTRGDTDAARWVALSGRNSATQNLRIKPAHITGYTHSIATGFPFDQAAAAAHIGAKWDIPADENGWPGKITLVMLFKRDIGSSLETSLMNLFDDKFAAKGLLT
jgi:hypothetical protein